MLLARVLVDGVGFEIDQMVEGYKYVEKYAVCGAQDILIN